MSSPPDRPTPPPPQSPRPFVPPPPSGRPAPPPNPPTGNNNQPQSPINFPRPPGSPLPRPPMPPVSPLNAQPRPPMPPTSPMNSQPRPPMPPVSPLNAQPRPPMPPTSPMNAHPRPPMPPNSTLPRPPMPPGSPMNATPRPPMPQLSPTNLRPPSQAFPQPPSLSPSGPRPPFPQPPRPPTVNTDSAPTSPVNGFSPPRPPLQFPRPPPQPGSQIQSDHPAISADVLTALKFPRGLPAPKTDSSPTPRPPAPSSNSGPRPPPPRPSVQGGRSDSPSEATGGFNSNLLMKARTNSNTKTGSNQNSDDEGWSSEEETPPPPAKTRPSATPTTSTSLKQPVSRPPAVSRPPPRKSLEVNLPPTTNNISPAKIPIPPPAPPTINSARSGTPPDTKTTTINASVSTQPNKSREPSPSVSPPAINNPLRFSTPPPPSVPSPPLQTSDLKKLESGVSAIESINVAPEVVSPPPPPPPSNNAALQRSNERIKELELEVFELKKKLEKSESRLLQSQTTSLSGSSNREALLEKELDEAYEKIDAMKKTKKSLEHSVVELQHRLTAAETKNAALAPTTLSELVAVEAAIKQGERERVLEEQLVKAKKDKEKAIRLIIHLVGKDRLNEFMQQHAGSPDILDSMMLSFKASSLGSPAKTSNTKTTSESKNKKPVAVTRSRMDEYFKTVIVQNEV